MAGRVFPVVLGALAGAALLAPTVAQIAPNATAAPSSSNSMLPALDVSSDVAIAIVASVVGLVVIAAVIACYTCKQHRRARKEDAEALASMPNNLLVNGHEVPILPRASIQILPKRLGAGNFANVFAGKLRPNNKGNEVIPVAIKCVRAEDGLLDEKGLKDMLCEAAIMSTLEHPNIIRLFGVVHGTNGTPAIVMEQADATLKTWLDHQRVVGKRISDIGASHLIRFSQQIASAMDYMGAQRIVHRDLAARNVLLGADLSVKISDMGLSRDMFEKMYYRLQNVSGLPIRWMPPETLNYHVTTSKSDVWSFGITMWEIFALGRSPYEGCENDEVPNLLERNQRLEQPEACPGPVYDLMRLCWLYKAENRPTFSTLDSTLKDIQNMNIDVEKTGDFADLRQNTEWDFKVTDPRVENRLACVLYIGESPNATLYRGLLRQAAGPPVATSLLTFNEACSEDQKRAFVREAAILLNVDHPSVQKFYGEVQVGDKVYLAIELPDTGKLQDLVQQQPLALKEQLPILRQIALAMEAVHAKEIVHANLHLRSIALSGARAIRLTGFGRAGMLDPDTGKLHEPDMPIERHTALEARTDGIYSKASDVWSFGCLMWEVLEHGNSVFGSKTEAQITELLRNGGIPRKPAECPANLFELIKNCWARRPEERPSFTKLANALKSLASLNSTLKRLNPVTEIALDDIAPAAHDPNNHDLRGNTLGNASLYPMAV